MKLSELLEDFCISKQIEEGCSPNTARAYEYDLKMLVACIGDKELNTIKPIHIRQFLKTLHFKKYSKRGVARKIACFGSFFKFCMENRYIEENPMFPIKTPKINNEEMLPKFLNLDEMKNILKILSKPSKSIDHSKLPYFSFKRLKIIVPLLYSSMGRVSEICNLKIEDINLKDNFIKVRGKGNKERYIPIDLQTTNLIGNYIENRLVETNFQRDQFLFLNNHHKPLNPQNIQQDLKKLKKYLHYPESKKLTPHVFRHTGATHLRQNGMDISELQDILGHANPNTTRIYAKNDLSSLQKSYLRYHPLSIKGKKN